MSRSVILNVPFETTYSRYLNTLNIDKDILSMKNFNVYDPMKRGQGLVLDGQTLAHIEAGNVFCCMHETLTS